MKRSVQNFGELYLVVVIVRQVGAQAVSDQDTCLESPGTRNVAHRVTTTAKDHGGKIKAFNEVDTIGMAAHTQIETTQAIARQAITTTLQYNSLGAVPFHHTLDNRLKDALVGEIIDTVSKREVDGVILSITHTNITQLTCTGEVLAVLVERHGHHTICRVKGLFNTIAVMHINVDIQYSLLETQKF